MPIDFRILSLTLFVLFSCSGQSGSEGVEYLPLSGITCETANAEDVFRICHVTDSLIIAKSSSDNYLVAGNWNSREISFSSFASKGRGPGEFRYAVTEVYGDTLYIAENQGALQKIVAVPLNALQDKSLWKYSDFSQIGNLHVASFCHRDASHYLFAGGEYGKEELLTVVDASDLSVADIISFWPEDGFDGSNNVKQTVYLRNSTVHANHDRILFTCGEGRFAVLYYLDSLCRVAEKKVIFQTFPDYGDKGDGLNPSLKAGALRGIKAYVTEKNLYFMLHRWKDVGGKTIPPDYKGYPAVYDDRIEVYDWYGNFQCAFQTDVPFVSFGVTPDNSCLFALTKDLTDESVMIRKYTLPLTGRE